MNDKIEPCAFCGMRCYTRDESFGMGSSLAYYVLCSNESCDYRGGRYWGDEAEAIRIHNDLHAPSSEPNETPSD